MQAAAPKARPVGELSVCKGKEPEMTFARGLREGEGALEGARGPTRNGCLSCELRPYHPEIIPGTAGRSSDHEGTKTTPPPSPEIVFRMLQRLGGPRGLIGQPRLTDAAQRDPQGRAPRV